MICKKATDKRFIGLLMAMFMVAHSYAEKVLNIGFDEPSELNTLSLSRESKAWAPDGEEVAPDSACLTRGMSGRGIYLSGTASNELALESRRGVVEASGIKAVGGAEIRTTPKAWEGDEAIQATTTSALNSGVALAGLQVVGKNGAEPLWYVASAYVRGEGSIVFLAEDEARNIVFPPLEVRLTKPWHRVVIKFPVAKSTDAMALKWLATGGSAAEFSLDGLQLERSRAGRYGWASQWLPGGEIREADIMSVRLWKEVSHSGSSLTGVWFHNFTAIMDGNSLHEVFCMSMSSCA